MVLGVAGHGHDGIDQRFHIASRPATKALEQRPYLERFQRPMQLVTLHRQQQRTSVLQELYQNAACAHRERQAELRVALYAHNDFGHHPVGHLFHQKLR